VRTIPLLSYPKLDIPTSQETAVFRVVDQVLSNDPALAATINTYLSWRGTNLDTIEPALNLCPFLRISPVTVQTQWATEIQHLARPSIIFEIATVGTNYDNLGNVWGLIRAAFFPQSMAAARDAVQTTLRGPLGDLVTKPTIRLLAFGPFGGDEGGNGAMLVGRGTIEFGTLLHT
jgi:hypothetical protein